MSTNLYNKGQTCRTLMHNWQEEQILENVTGNRRVTWTQSASGQQRPDNSLSSKRCMGLEAGSASAKDWNSSNRSLHSHPQVEENKNLRYHLEYTQGARQQFLAREFDKMATQMLQPPQKVPIRCLDTTNRSDFSQHAPSNDAPARRIMRNQDGQPAERKDFTFLVETGIIKSHQVPAEIDRSETHSFEQLATTLYNDTDSTMFTGCTAVGPSNPHNRNPQYSLPIQQFKLAPVKDL
jgi:hypothetical protein